MRGWLVGRAGHNEFTPRRRDEVAAWLRTLDLDPERFALQLAVTEEPDGYRLHLTRYLLDEQGQKYLDVAADRPAQAPVVVSVDAGSWPTWLTGLGTYAHTLA